MNIQTENLDDAVTLKQVCDYIQLQTGKTPHEQGLSMLAKAKAVSVFSIREDGEIKALQCFHQVINPFFGLERGQALLVDLSNGFSFASLKL
jgi:hypothetical protein